METDETVVEDMRQERARVKKRLKAMELDIAAELAVEKRREGN